MIYSCFTNSIWNYMVCNIIMVPLNFFICNCCLLTKRQFIHIVNLKGPFCESSIISLWSMVSKSRSVDVYSTRHVKMDSASRVSLEANLATNASRGASHVSFDNKQWVEYSYCMPLNQIPSTELKVSRKFREADSWPWNVCFAFFQGFTFCPLSRVVYCMLKA